MSVASLDIPGDVSRSDCRCSPDLRTTPVLVGSSHFESPRCARLQIVLDGVGDVLVLSVGALRVLPGIGEL